VPNVLTDPEKEFEEELQAFDNDVDESIQCFYTWRTVHAEARRSRKIFNLLNQHAGFWVVALGSIQANSIIALGRIFDRDPRSHNVERLVKIAEKNKAIFSKDAVRQRKTKDLANTIHLVDDYMKNLLDPTPSDFKWLESFVNRRRKVYERCYKQIRDKWYAHKDRTNISGFVAQTNVQELGRLVTDLRNLHEMLWHWYRNGLKPRARRLRGSAGVRIRLDTREFLNSLIS
jgi:hypothetical protein